MALDPNGAGGGIDMQALINAIAQQVRQIGPAGPPIHSVPPPVGGDPRFVGPPVPGGPYQPPGPVGPPIHQMPPPTGTDPRFVGPPVRPGGGNMKPPGPAGQYLGPPQQDPPIRMEQQAMAPAHVARAYANALRRIGNPRRGRQPYRPRYE